MKRLLLDAANSLLQLALTPLYWSLRRALQDEMRFGEVHIGYVTEPFPDVQGWEPDQECRARWELRGL